MEKQLARVKPTIYSDCTSARVVGLFIIALLFYCTFVNAQTINGRVYDKATGEPVFNAHVYLNGSSFYTTTDDSGTYQLKTTTIINTQLIISHLAYETFVIENPFEKESIDVYLTEKTFLLEEVVIKTGPFSPKEKMKAFEQQFLGDNKAGKSCIIQNKEDINLFFDEDDKTLYAKCFEPLIVINNFLGYKMTFTLTDFHIQYTAKSLRTGQIEYVVMRGNVFFEDIAPLNPVIKKRRNDAYKSSLNYFFKSLANNTFGMSNHVMYNRSNSNSYWDFQHAIPANYFDITDNGSQKKVHIIDYSDINKFTNNLYKFPLPITGVITVADPVGNRSEIIFLTDEFTIDAFGVVDKKDFIYVTGNMSNQRAGNMVPIDYNQE